MIKLRVLALAAVLALGATPAFAGGKACCAKQAANDTSMKCVSFANLNISADQKSKLEAWQSECMQAGCTKESHEKFLKQAKGVLSADQYAALKKECGSGHDKMRS